MQRHRSSTQVQLPHATIAPVQTRFMNWARDAMAPLSAVDPGPPWDDLEPLGKMIGDSTIVALGEGMHCGAEPLHFRNRLLQYLVEEKGFTGIAIESGIVESRIVHDYVRGGSGDLRTVLAQGIGWTFDRLPQNLDLVKWLRDYNSDLRCVRKVDFYGFDVPGSAGNPNTNRGVDTALTEVLAYIDSVDAVNAAALRARIDGLLINLCFDPGRTEGQPGYDRLTQPQRDILTAFIAELVMLLERKEAQYTQARGAREYQWAHRAAIGACQVDHWLRQIPLHWHPGNPAFRLPNEQALFVLIAEEMRDRAQADNLDWIIRQQGAGGKLLVFGHRFHLSTAPVKRIFGNGGDESQHQVAGTYLRRRLGSSLLTIGNLIGGGEVGCGEYRQSLEKAPPDSIDGFIGDTQAGRFVLDLRAAPPAMAEWINRERSRELGVSHRRQRFTVSVGKAFDVLLYMDTVTPAGEIPGI